MPQSLFSVSAIQEDTGSCGPDGCLRQNCCPNCCPAWQSEAKNWPHPTGAAQISVNFSCHLWNEGKSRRKKKTTLTWHWVPLNITSSKTISRLGFCQLFPNKAGRIHTVARATGHKEQSLRFQNLAELLNRELPCSMVVYAARVFPSRVAPPYLP